MSNRFSLLSEQSYGSYIGELNNSQTSLMDLVTDKLSRQSNQSLVSQSLSAPSVLSANPLANNLINPIVTGNALSNMKLGNQITGEIDYSTNRMVNSLDSINDSINNSAQLNALSNMLGALMTSGTIAISAGMIISQMKELKSGIERLGSVFTEGMSLISTKLDIQNHIMTNIQQQLEKIHNTLNSPTMTKAKEQRDLGLDRLTSDLLPEAKEAFINALSYDETDPISNLMLGKIYLDGVDSDFNFHDPKKAIEYFQKATRYSNAFYKKIPDLKDTKADAIYLSSLAFIASDKSEENIFKALDILNNLLKEFPEHTQGLYLKVKLLIILNRRDEAIDQCANLIGKDFTYISVALKDDDFQTSKIGQLLIENMINFYNEQIFAYSESLRILADEMESLNIEINTEVTDYLDKYFNKNDRIIINNPSNEILALLMLLEVSSENVIEEKLHEYLQEFEELKASTLNLIEHINFEYIDSNIKTSLPLHNKQSLYDYIIAKDIKNYGIAGFVSGLNEFKADYNEVVYITNFSIMVQNTLNKYIKLRADKVNFFNDVYDSNANFVRTLSISFFILIVGVIFSVILYNWMEKLGGFSIIITILIAIGALIKNATSTVPSTNEKIISSLTTNLIEEVRNNSSHPLGLKFKDRLLDKFLGS